MKVLIMVRNKWLLISSLYLKVNNNNNKKINDY